MPASDDPTRPLLGVSSEPLHRRYSSTEPGSRSRSGIQVPLEGEVSEKEMRRGEVFATLSGGLFVFAWVLFLGTAWWKLGMKKDTGR
jgi:hypothetical protein